MELGLMSFADMQPESLAGSGINAQQRLKDLMEEIKLADELGLDVFGVGEHHRPDYAVSSPTVILGAAAAITRSFIRWTCRNNGGPWFIHRIFSFVWVRSAGLR